MKFIHTADLHLDSPLKGLSFYADAPVERLRTATRDAFSRLVGRAIEEQVDFMVIAGDVYDGDWRDFNTGLYFARQMGRLRQAGIAVYLLHGNHDAENEMTRALELPDNVHTFSARRAQTFRVEHWKVALHGRSFRSAATTENLLPGYPDPVPGWLNIGVLHTALEGHAEHPRYAPCSLAELRARGYQYWALGHVHQRWIERGAVTIAYPGNLQGRHVREPGPRGALLVTAIAEEIIDVEVLEVDVVRWQTVDVDLRGIRERAAAIRAAGHALEQVLGETPGGLPLAVRVRFVGRSVAHTALIADEAQLRQEVLAQAVAIDPDRLWIEKVRVESSAPESQLAASAGELKGSLTDMARLMVEAGKDPDLLRSLQDDWRALLASLPLEVLSASMDLKALREDPMAEAPRWLKFAAPLAMGRVAQASARVSES
jgi:DNA repair exonuclease SbcCD nuclease subunit